MRAAIQCGLLFVVLSTAASRWAAGDTTSDRWEAALTHAQSLIQERTNEVRDVRKKTDVLVEQLNRLAQSNVFKMTPEAKREVARKRLQYYTQLGNLNAAAVDLEQRMPKQVAPFARQKVLDMLAVLRGELRATVVALNHVARAVNDL